MAQQFVNNTHYTEALMMEAYRKYLGAKNLRRNLITLLIALAVLAVVAGVLVQMATGQRPFNVLYLLLLVAPVALVWMVLFDSRAQARRVYAAMMQTGKMLDITYTFNDEGFVIETGLETVEVNWPRCTRRYETKHLCLIAEAGNLYAIDLGGFSTGSAENFMQLVREKVPSKPAKAAK